MKKIILLAALKLLVVDGEKFFECDPEKTSAPILLVVWQEAWAPNNLRQKSVSSLTLILWFIPPTVSKSTFETQKPTPNPASFDFRPLSVDL